MIKLDHLAVIIAIGAIVILSIWPLASHHGGGDHGHDDHGASHSDADHGGDHSDSGHDDAH